MPSLFLSYRRADSPDTVALLRERIAARFRQWDVFYDHYSLPPGEPFPDALRKNVTAADVVLVVIGPRWLDSLRERVGRPGVDFVREEVRLALAGGRAVLPVRVGHAAMPSAADLAAFPDLARLADLSAPHVRPDPDLEPDVAKLLDVIDGFGPGVGPGTLLGGKYKLVREIGVGGMGVVYLAEQTDPDRKVAVKLIKPGMDSREVLARFDAELEALGRMKHPHVAGVLDSGTTPAGRPYFVMEYVRGLPITRHCDDQKLPVAERLRLFQKVCDAVQHAHQKGIIHRDIKPSNVLVEVVDGLAVPKVIDFGLAKALGGRLTDRTLYTDHRAFVGTLEYASPEQAAGADLDTRTDVYSLGALLYELLSGSPPFTSDELEKAGDEAARRLVRESDPPRLEKRLSSSAGRAEVAARRGTDPDRLGRAVRGELDWIVSMGLDKERDRRYATAAAFGEDVGRYLANEPLVAGRPTAAYRVRKFVRRNRGPVVAAGLVFAALVAGMVGTTMGLVKAESARVRADAARLRAEVAEDDARKGWAGESEQRAKADRRRQEADEQRTEAERQRTDAVEQRRQAVEQRVRTEEQKQRAEAGEHLAKVQKQRAEEKELEAKKWLTEAEKRTREVQIQARLAEGNARQANAAKEDAEAVLTFFQEMVLAAGRPEGQEGGLGRDVPLRKAVDVAESKVSGAFKHRPQVEAAIRSTLHVTYSFLGEPGLALRQAEKAYDLWRRVKDQSHPDVLNSLHNLAHAYRAYGQKTKSIEMFERCFECMKQKFGPDHRDTLTSMNNLAYSYVEEGDLVRALPLLRLCLDKRRATLGVDHLDTLNSVHNLACAHCAYTEDRDLPLAMSLFETCLKVRRTKLGPDHPDTLNSRANLAYTLAETERIALALPLFEECLERRRKTLGDDHPDVRVTRSNLATAYVRSNQLLEAKPLFESEFYECEGCRRSLDGEHYYRLLDLCLSLRHYTQAADLTGEALDNQRRWGHKDDDKLIVKINRHAFVMLNLKQFAGAEQLLREAIAILDKKHAVGRGAGQVRSNLGAVLFAQNKVAEAEPFLLQGIDLILAEGEDVTPKDILNDRVFLPDKFRRQVFNPTVPAVGPSPTPIDGVLVRAERIPDANRPQPREALERLVRLYESTGRSAEAAKWRAKLPPERAPTPRPAK